MKKSGFTLVELLVVVSIIAILAVIGMAVFGNVQRNARDAKRRADINAIANAMEVNYGKVTAWQYSSLMSVFFSSGQIPTDPINTGTTCSGNECKYCFRQSQTVQQSEGICNPADPRVAQGDPAGGTWIYWIVCANLETASGINNATHHCRGNQQ